MQCAAETGSPPRAAAANRSSGGAPGSRRFGSRRMSSVGGESGLGATPRPFS
ncbi:hypothetical protein BMAFMH_E0605 [Burkholderia mallei FMH]|nr:hypothetical protein BMAFMH_E0605 [Burkholderia mallei FMH]